MNPYRPLISDYSRLLREGGGYPLGGFPPLPRPQLKPDAPTVLIFSPHPDDECILGGLPLRLMREAGLNLINVAVTQGSNKARQAERWQELQAACEFIGFGLVQTRPGGLEKINVKTRQQEPALWQANVRVIADILGRERPCAIFFPHDRDWNSTHIGTHHLVADALASLGPDFTCFTVETEFWGAMDDPNLMVESSAEDVADLIAALTFHVGEVRRNPYHLSMPAWLIDNVRRGAELVGGQGGAAPDFAFATLYRLRRWTGGRFEKLFEGGRLLPVGEPPGKLFASV
jgi:LmbE family N-acetylglucosaminyl deacetylase